VQSDLIGRARECIEGLRHGVGQRRFDASEIAWAVISELVKVVEKLPKIGSGEPAFLGMNVWVDRSPSQRWYDIGKPRIIAAGILKLWLDEDRDYTPRAWLRTSTGREFGADLSDLFSSESAARAAKESHAKP
jgi:hypothetical protein